MAEADPMAEADLMAEGSASRLQAEGRNAE
jgi:hypothetical protein